MTDAQEEEFTKKAAEYATEKSNEYYGINLKTADYDNMSNDSNIYAFWLAKYGAYYDFKYKE